MKLRREQFLRRRSVWKTTWLTRLLVGAVIVLVVLLTGRFWLVWIGESLVHDDELTPVDLIVVEDFNESYWLYRRTANLRAQGLSDRVLVLKSRFELRGELTGLLAEEAELTDYQRLESGEGEPIALGAAQALRDYLDGSRVDSILVVTMGFRSRRTHLIYTSVFEPLGIRVLCNPVLGPRRPDTWWHSWHGVQEIALEFLKLQYYRFWIL